MRFANSMVPRELIQQLENNDVQQEKSLQCYFTRQDTITINIFKGLCMPLTLKFLNVASFNDTFDRDTWQLLKCLQREKTSFLLHLKIPLKIQKLLKYQQHENQTNCEVSGQYDSWPVTLHTGMPGNRHSNDDVIYERTDSLGRAQDDDLDFISTVKLYK